MRALALTLAALFLLPAAAQANVYVASQAENSTTGITGLVQLGDAGGELLRNGSGGAAIAGTGVGPIVYNSGGTGSIRQLSGNGYTTLATGVGGGITSMTMTGRGLVVANANKLQYLSGGQLTDVLHGTISDGPWVSITTLPNGHLVGWAWNNGWGSLYDFNLAGGTPTKQDYTGQVNDPFFNNRNNGGLVANAPVPNSGGISADGTGALWLANGGYIGTFETAKVYRAAPNSSSFSPVSDGDSFDQPRVATTGDGKAYVSDTYTGPNEGHVYKFSASGIEKEVTSATGDLVDSNISALAVDRCYTTCAVAPKLPVQPGGTGGTGGNNTGTSKSPLTLPKAKSVKLGKKGLGVKLTCATNCTVTVTGSLTFGKAKKATAAANKVSKTKVSLKAGKAKTVSVKLTKKMRKKVKKALRRKQKVTAKLKLSVKPATGKAFTRNLKLRVK